jgi:NADH dehydrogenase FAD-containing subunit
MVGESRLTATVVIWSAGVQASPLGRLLGAEVDKQGHVVVDQFLHPAGRPEIFVCGDLATYVVYLLMWSWVGQELHNSRVELESDLLAV